MIRRIIFKSFALTAISIISFAVAALIGQSVYGVGETAAWLQKAELWCLVITSVAIIPLLFGRDDFWPTALSFLAIILGWVSLLAYFHSHATQLLPLPGYVLHPLDSISLTVMLVFLVVGVTLISSIWLKRDWLVFLTFLCLNLYSVLSFCSDTFADRYSEVANASFSLLLLMVASAGILTGERLRASQSMIQEDSQ